MATKIISYQNCLGLNTRKHTEDIKSPDAPKPYPANFESLAYEVDTALNIEIDAANMPNRREGYVAIDAVDTHSLWANHERSEAYCIRGSWLCSIDTSFNVTPLHFVGPERMMFQEVPGAIYATNGTQLLTIVDGVVTNLPSVSQDFKAQMVAGQCISFFRGRLYVAKDDVLWFSDAFRFFKRDMRFNFKPFSGFVDMVAYTVDGLYVSAGGITYFLTGDNPHKFDLRPIAGYGAIYGSLTYVNGSQIKDGLYNGEVPVWASTEGLCFGYPAGKMVNMTSDKFIMASGSYGASLARPRLDTGDGYTQFITTIR
jgi:hypothetical protein